MHLEQWPEALDEFGIARLWMFDLLAGEQGSGLA
jgi:hypothetical protein